MKYVPNFVFLTFPLLRCTSSVPWLSSPCLFSGPRCPPTGFDLFPLLIICSLILDINNQSSYSLVFFAPSKGSTPSLFLFFFPLLIWASQVIMMIMVFIFNLSVSSYIFVKCELIFRFFLSRLNLHNDGSCDRALYYSLSPILQDQSQLGGLQVS